MNDYKYYMYRYAVPIAFGTCLGWIISLLLGEILVYGVLFTAILSTTFSAWSHDIVKDEYVVIDNNEPKSKTCPFIKFDWRGNSYYCWKERCGCWNEKGKRCGLIKGESEKEGNLRTIKLHFPENYWKKLLEKGEEEE